MVQVDLLGCFWDEKRIVKIWEIFEYNRVQNHKEIGMYSFECTILE